MAIGDAYVSLAEMKDYLQSGKSTKDQVSRYDALIAAAAESVSREVERLCERQFNRVDVASAREYDYECIRRYSDPRGRNRYEVIVDDFWTKDDLEVDIDGTVVTDYRLHPLNGMKDGVPGWPYWQIQHPSLGPESLVTVTARWGWESIPADVKQAVKISAAETYMAAKAEFGVIGSSETGYIMRLRDNQLAMSKINRFRRKAVRARG